MTTARWKVGRPARHARRARGWWLGFLWGMLLVLGVKGVLHYSASASTHAGSATYAAADAPSESAPIEREAANGQTTSGPQGQAVGPGQSDTYPDTSEPVSDKPISTAGEAAGMPNAPAMPSSKASPKLSAYDRLWVSVYLTKEKRIEKLPIELYVRGVLAGEMPIDFELEALKAQAIAARTYIYRRLLNGDRSGLNDASKNADVTDTVMNQVYVPIADLLNRWKGSAKNVNLNKLNEAVEATEGQIVTYDGEPIQASFFSTSNGYTEDASDYWNMDLPYLRSVTSPWDKALSPNYEQTTRLGVKQVASKLGVKANAVRAMRTLGTTAGERVETVKAGEKTFTGREIREKLSLPSSDFSWTIDGNEIAFTTKGYGHGVGMSQWGADGMAKNGGTARQILAHYYVGTKVVQASGVLD